MFPSIIVISQEIVFISIILLLQYSGNCFYINNIIITVFQMSVIISVQEGESILYNLISFLCQKLTRLNMVSNHGDILLQRYGMS